MANKAAVTLTGTGQSAIIPLNMYTVIATAIQLTVSGTNTSSVEVTLDDIQDPTVTPTWVGVTGLTGQTASVIGKIDYPVRGVRLNCTAFTSGSVTMRVLQGEQQY